MSMPLIEISCRDEKVRGRVILQSPDKKSLAVAFEALFLGYLGLIALYWDEARGCYIDLFFGNELSVEWLT